MRIYLNIDQHETNNPAVTIYNGVTLTATRLSAGINILTAANPIFTEGTGVFTTRQDHLADLSSGDLYGSREDEYTIKLVNWSHADGLPVDEINNVKILIEIP